MRKTWKVINNLIATGVCKHTIKNLIVNGTKFTDDISIAEFFGEYFSKVADNLDRELPVSVMDPLAFMGDQVIQSLFASC